MPLLPFATHIAQLKWSPSRRPLAAPPSLPPTITEQLSIEIYELIIDNIDDTRTLLACSLVCRSWAPRSRCRLSERMVCRTVPLVRYDTTFGFPITCAAVLDDADTPDIIFGSKNGIYRTVSINHTASRLLRIQDVSQIEVLPDADLVLCLAGSSVLTLSLAALLASSAHPTQIWRRVACLAVRRSAAVAEPHRVCVLETSSLSATLKVYDVNVNNNPTGQGAAAAFTQDTPLETIAIRFLSRTEILATLKKGFAVQKGFEITDLSTSHTRALLDSRDPTYQALSVKNCKPITVFRVSHYLACYDKLAFFIGHDGKGLENGPALKWIQILNSESRTWKLCFLILKHVLVTHAALHDRYLFAFCSNCVEVWNIVTFERVQRIIGPYDRLNTEGEEEKITGLSLLSGDIQQISFMDSEM
ncbi:sulfhydryl oxidase [Favolaschia claudopus]|uniref:Sulfhydryl oxidase n=1 Tax=Favolaschia claudopus TaxID=2862362 RepID=A0AAW0BGI4_9AGAR